MGNAGPCVQFSVGERFELVFEKRVLALADFEELFDERVVLELLLELLFVGLEVAAEQVVEFGFVELLRDFGKLLRNLVVVGFGADFLKALLVLVVFHLVASF